MRQRHVAQVDDITAADHYPAGADTARQFGHHTVLSAPLLPEGAAIGVISIRRLEVRPFSEKSSTITI
jgi:hypothetical protein